MTSHWFSVSLGDGITAAGPSAEIEETYQRSSLPADAAVFLRSEEGRLHCEVIAYFSPAAADLAIQFEAKPCAQPLRTGLRLLAGEERSWSVLFDQDSS
jgi:hypothetical protein